MGSCDKSAIVDNLSSGSVIEQHVCSNFAVHNSCSEVASNVLDSNIANSNVLDSCMHLSKNNYNDFLNFDNVTEFSIASKDGFVCESENADSMAVEKMLNNDCGICLSGCCSHISGFHSESGELCLEKGPLTGGGEDEMASKFVSDLPESCVQEGEQKHAKSNTGPTAVGSSVVQESRSDNIADLVIGGCSQISSSGVCEIPLELLPMTGLPIHFPQQNEQEDVNRVADPLLEDVDKSDSLSRKEVDTFMHSSSSLGEDTLSKLLNREAGNDFDQLDDQNDCKERDSPYEERVIEIVDIESNTNMHIQVSPSHVCQSPLRDIILAGSPGMYVLQGQREDKSDVDPCAKVMEQNVDFTKDINVESKSNTLPIEDSTFETKDGSLVTVASSTYEKPISPLLCQPSSVFISNSFLKDIPNLLSKYDTGSPGSSCAVDHSGQTDNEGKNDVKVDCATESKCLDIVSSSSRRSSRRSKSSRKTRTKKPVRKQKDKAEVSHPSDSKIILNAARRKRSCSSKPPRSSIWGLFGDIRQYSEQSNGVGINHFMCYELGKARGSRESGKMNKNNSSGSAWGSINNHITPTTRVRLKVKLGKEIVQSSVNIFFPEVVDASVPANSEIGLDTQRVASLVEDNCGDEGAAVNFGSSNDTEEDACVLNGEFANNHIACNVIMEKSGGDTDNCPAVPSDGVVEALGEALDNKGLDPGTSPDSEVINSILEVQVGERHEDVHGVVLPSPNGFTSLADVISSKREKNNVTLPHAGSCILEGAEAKTTASIDVDYGSSDPHDSKDLRKLPKSLTSRRATKGKSKSSNSNKRGTACKYREKQQKSVNKIELIGKGVADKIVCEVGDHLDTGNSVDQMADNIGKADAANSIAFQEVSCLDNLPVDGLGEQYLPPRNAWVRCDDCHKWRRIPAVLADLIEEKNCTWTCKDSKDKAFAHCSIAQEKSNAEINAELGLSDASGEEDAYDACKNYKALEFRRPIVPQESTFTRILTNEFLHRSHKTQTIDEVMVCYCKPPPDAKFGCKDECLNRMLNIECVQGTCPCGDLCSNQQFQKHNYAELEWFRCGKKGYGLHSLEDISKGQFLIEYVGEVLDMHAHEARQREYALKGHRHFYFMTLNGSEVIDASAKGNLGRFINHSCEPNCRTEKWMVNGEICIGLFALRDIKKGEEVTFDYNYVRVLGAAAKKCYCGTPQCRGYIGGDPLNTEVIVQGDSDEEFPEPVMLTVEGDIVDGMPRANYTHGVKMQKARCRSKDSDRYNKSITTVEQLESSTEKENSTNPTSAVSQLQSSIELINSKGKLVSSIQVEEISRHTEDVTSKPMSAVRQYSFTDEEVLNTTSCTIERSEISSSVTAHGKLLSDSIDNNNRESKYDSVEDKPVNSKSHPRMKTSRSSSSVKKGKGRTNLPDAHKVEVTPNRSHVLSVKPKKAVEGSSIDRFEAVQEKLTELLDGDGGISKRKDSTKGYLKLLLLTAASGDSINGEAIQSNRDLSMILDALLKTKSRAVLVDIINKNGLRMLHNIMKQYRRDFKKIPILRKLLKVIEYLAVNKILTFDHINDDAPCHGMESFRESILSLTEHDDKQVHQIARSFRDRWIPRHFRKFNHADREDSRMEFQRGSNGNRCYSLHNHRQDRDASATEAIECVKHSSSITTSMDAGAQESCSTPPVCGSLTVGTRRRKRKSRWDQPADTNADSSHSQEQQVDSGLVEQVDSSLLHRSGEVSPRNTLKKSRENSYYSGCVLDLCQQDPVIKPDDERQNIHEDVPPGFSSPFHHHLSSFNYSSSSGDLPQQNAFHLECPDVVIGLPQEKFISRLPVSYGIPFSVVQQYGIPHAEIAGNWVTAPGMPFSPFPPLPPYPRNEKHHPPHPINPVTVAQPAVVGQWDTCGAAGCYLDGTTSNTTGANHHDEEISYGNKQMYKRVKGSSHDLGRRYFKQQKWCNTKVDHSCLQ
ncbi:Histone-lysine N-methyltransferase ASHH2 [Quillaja saponaria]|uniref:Histone-lysine N-methyltransferase ASHH2 n=1 Tax=Quillaja saponaria TaxID=32244 RepID=A0AAD7LJ97_QUISA|nr:Histone-lysine N-methyltransferase ASHH2 [Quillaja saponaria]KAJ7959180.1 Histone-lysine N-methyltransferase ASHH2 [Quillaja saponaria]